MIVAMVRGEPKERSEDRWMKEERSEAVILEFDLINF